MCWAGRSRHHSMHDLAASIVEEGTDQVGLLAARRALDARRHVDARRAGDAQRASATLPGVRPPESSQGTSGSKPASSVQSNGTPLPPGSVRTLRRLGVEQETVGDRLVGTRRGEIARLPDADRLHHRPAEALAQRGHGFRRLGAVQLQPVGAARLRRSRRSPFRRRRRSAPRSRRGRRRAAPVRAARAGVT